MTDKKDRGEALRDRLESGSETSETSETEETEETSEMIETSEKTESETTAKKTEKSQVKETVRERKNVNMYLPEDVVKEMQIRFDELNAQHRRIYDEPLEKNRDFYPALLRAGLEGEEIEELLGL